MSESDELNQENLSSTKSTKPPKDSSPSGILISNNPFLIIDTKHNLYDGQDYWIHKFLPTNSLFAALLFLSISLGIWLIALALAVDKTAFWESKEWHVQPLLFAGHLFTAWMFVLPFTKLFHRALSAMEGPKEKIMSWTNLVLGPRGLIGAILLSLPFQYMVTNSYLKGDYDKFFIESESSLAIVDLWMMTVWGIEWIINGYIWFILIGFIGLTISAMKLCTFTGSIEEVLIHERYKPFLLLIVQGSSSCLFFCLINSFYVWYAEGDISDFIGLGMTVGLLVGGFAPPWLMLRKKLEKEMQHRYLQLGTKLIEIDHQFLAHEGTPDNVYFQESAIISRINFLDRLKMEFGQKEGRSVLLRLLIPTATMGWKFFKPFFVG